MNKLAYGFLLVFCLGYITSDFIHESKLSPIAPAHAHVSDYDFTGAVEDIVEDCSVYVDNDYGSISC